MLAAPERDAPTVSPDDFDVRMEHVARPTVEFYRSLYEGVGRRWNWWFRSELSDDELAAIVQDPRVEVFVMHVGEQFAGYGELDRRVDGEVEIAYMGLTGDFIGRGLGRYLVDWLVDRAWSYAPTRLWLHTCTLDHPGALPNYLRAGFEVYDHEVHDVDESKLETD